MAGLINSLRSWLKPPLTREQVTARADQELIRRETKRLERKLVRAQQRMAESLYGDDDYIDPSEYPGGANDDDGNYGWGNGGAGGIAGTTNARATGGDWILLRTPMDRRRLLADARILWETNSYAAGFGEQLVNFIIGKGMEVDFVLKGAKPGAVSGGGVVDADADGSPDTAPAVKKAEDIFEAFREKNYWGTGEQDREIESCRRVERDSENILRFFPADDGICKIRFVEPEQIEPPPGDPDPRSGEIGYSSDYAWTWGIKCDADDVETVESYYVRPMNNLVAGFVGKVIDASEVVFFKIGTDRAVKRGIPPFAIVAKAFRQCEKINNNMAEVTAIQAAIAYIREHAATTLPGQAADLIAGAQNYTTAQRSRGGDKIVGNEIIQPGSRLDVSSGLKYLPGPSATGADGYIKVLQSRLRQICARFGMPEFFTGDSSNANYASTLVSGGPFERSISRKQQRFAGFTKAVVRKVLEYATEAGLLTEEELASLEITVTPDPATIANKLEEAQIRQIEIADKIVSVQTAQQETGRDTAKEAANIKAWQQQFPDTNGAGLGADFEGLMGADNPQKKPDAVNPASGGLFGEQYLAEIGSPPFPGAVFDRGKHRWVKGGGDDKAKINRMQAKINRMPAEYSADPGKSGEDKKPGEKGDEKAKRTVTEWMDKRPNGGAKPELDDATKEKYHAEMSAVLTHMPPGCRKAEAYYANHPDGRKPELEEIFEKPVISGDVTGDVLISKKPAKESFDPDAHPRKAGKFTFKGSSDAHAHGAEGVAAAKTNGEAKAAIDTAKTGHGESVKGTRAAVKAEAREFAASQSQLPREVRSALANGIAANLKENAAHSGDYLANAASSLRIGDRDAAVAYLKSGAEYHGEASHGYIDPSDADTMGIWQSYGPDAGESGEEYRTRTAKATGADLPPAPAGMSGDDCHDANEDAIAEAQDAASAKLIEAWNSRVSKIVREVTDASGHEHDDLGRFGSGGGTIHDKLKKLLEEHPEHPEHAETIKAAMGKVSPKEPKSEPKEKPKSDPAAKETANNLNAITDKWVAAVDAKKPPSDDEMKAAVIEAVGKTSPHQIAAELGYQSKFKNNADAMAAIIKSTVGRVGTYLRSGA